jgi:ubiquinone/menaquinone biosynthesis C-methylase UbiE
MVNVRAAEPAHDTPDASTVELFQRDWQIYRKMVDNDYLFHRGAYGALRHFLVELNRPFAFLDLACGDASVSASILAGTQISSYRGIDFSDAALDLAKANIAALGIPYTLERRDFVEAVSEMTEPVDIAWIGLSLHHLHMPEKGAFLTRMRRLTVPGGAFLVYENASPDGETRAEWMRRWDAQEQQWTAYSKDEWDAVTTHVHAADFPETDATWRDLGHDAGFANVRQLFRSPTDMFRVYCFMP